MATKKAPSSKAAAKTSSAKNTSQLLDLIPAQETQANAAAPNTADSADTADTQAESPVKTTRKTAAKTTKTTSKSTTKSATARTAAKTTAKSASKTTASKTTASKTAAAKTTTRRTTRTKKDAASKAQALQFTDEELAAMTAGRREIEDVRVHMIAASANEKAFIEEHGLPEKSFVYVLDKNYEPLQREDEELPPEGEYTVLSMPEEGRTVDRATADTADTPERLLQASSGQASEETADEAPARIRRRVTVPKEAAGVATKDVGRESEETGEDAGEELNASSSLSAFIARELKNHRTTAGRSKDAEQPQEQAASTAEEPASDTSPDGQPDLRPAAHAGSDTEESGKDEPVVDDDEAGAGDESTERSDDDTDDPDYLDDDEDGDEDGDGDDADEEDDEAPDAGDRDDEPELDDAQIEELVSRNVSLQEAKAGNDEDISPFPALFQYGDGHVESCIIGASDQPRMTPSEPERTHSFFRVCRRVQIAETKDTPLPAQGYWIPSHPAPRSVSGYNQFAHAAPQVKVLSPEQVALAHDKVAAMEHAHIISQPKAQQVADAAPAPVSAPAGGSGRRILICWVGKVDVSAALRHDTINPGPIRMLLEHVPPFDHVLLLTTMTQSVLDTLRTWLSPCISGEQLEIQRTPVTDLSDHAQVSHTATEAVDSIIERFHLPPTGEGITFHLSPGSPVTHAILILLACTRYTGVTLMQTRLTGLGKEPDIVTVTLPEEIAEALAVLNTDKAAPGARRPALPQGTESGQDTATRNPAPSFLSRHKTRQKETDLLQRFRAYRKPHAAPKPAPAPQPAPQPVPTQPTVIQAITHDSLPLDLDLPMAMQEESSLRAPAVSIGKPSRVSATALQPKEGDPPTISAALGKIYAKMQRVATMYLPILLLGESGSGKSRLARYIHEWSGRGGKFISLDCAGLTDEMFICELFGRGSASGAKPREGAFRKVRTGTLFLENVNRLTPTQQSMLVRILAPVGETKIALPASAPFPACTVRIRVIASADTSLMADIRAGRFRTDLYYRLAGVSTTLPPVREYSYEERENLLRSFLVNLQQKLGQCWNFSGDAWQTLLDEKWPGNLREVARILQQICLLSDSEATITREDVLQQLRQGRCPMPSDLDPYHQSYGQSFSQSFGSVLPGHMADAASMPPSDFGPIIAGAADEEDEDETGGEGNGDFFVLGSGQNLDDTLSNMRIAKITEAMNKTNGNRVEAAKLLGLSYVQLNYTLKHMMNQNQGRDSND